MISVDLVKFFESFQKLYANVELKKFREFGSKCLYQKQVFKRKRPV